MYVLPWKYVRTPAGIFQCVKFETLTAVELAIQAYEKQLGISYWRRDTRTIEAAGKRVKNVSIVSAEVKENVQYYELQYCCIKGARLYTPRAGTFYSLWYVYTSGSSDVYITSAYKRVKQMCIQLLWNVLIPPNICDTSKWIVHFKGQNCNLLFEILS